MRGGLLRRVTLDPSSAASPIVDERHRRDSHTSAFAKEADGMRIGRRETIFELADRGVDRPCDLCGVTSPLGLVDTIDHE
jgi:hypothetical protein